ncbi:hypothetical protein NPIL_121681 [Nephila pilipes]|uniref:Uncharacterized protein n=1 Tax=Nephila pilipes TaxID=299642 RepID=A0A8X6I4T7_NEPPI|nr:hypothetical protein NPIL_121681 [Nephila pilipes]
MFRDLTKGKPERHPSMPFLLLFGLLQFVSIWSPGVGSQIAIFGYHAMGLCSYVNGHVVFCANWVMARYCVYRPVNVVKGVCVRFD